MNMEKKTLATATPKSSDMSTLHHTDGNTHFVGIGPMKVIICHDDGAWFAQGVDIDYAANGTSLANVKQNFEVGLAGTIDLHIKLYGNLKKFLKHAPQEVWDELYAVGTHHSYTHVSFHDDLTKTLGLTGYDGIGYVSRNEAVAA